MRHQRLLTWLYGLLTVLAGAAVLWLAWRVLRALGPVVAVTAAGALLAVLLHPLADRIQRAIRSRPLAALAVVLLILAPFVVGATLLVTTVLREAQGLLTRLPAQLAYANAILDHWQRGLQRLGVHVDLAGQLQAAGGAVLRRSITVLSGIATVTTDTVLTLVVAFFLIWDGTAILRSAHNLLPRAWRDPAVDVARILAAAVGGYIRGQFLVAGVFGAIIGASMALLGMPYPVLLGFLAGLFELLPTVGPFLAAAGPVGLALAQPFPHVLWVLLVFVAAQQLESNVLVPRISGGAVGLHPLTVILAVFGGWSVAGLAGAFLAVPAVAVVRELLRRWWRPAIPPPLGARWPAPRAAPSRPAAAAEPGGATSGAPGGQATSAGGSLRPLQGPGDPGAVPAQPPAPPAPRLGRRQRARGAR